MISVPQCVLFSTLEARFAPVEEVHSAAYMELVRFSYVGCGISKGMAAALGEERECSRSR